MPNGSGKPEVGRQPHLPFNRAFKISMNSLKIRFWRSTITAGGIFLGIAFLGTILTQQLMQWPLPEKIEPGYIRIAGQVVNPYDFPAWKPVPVQEGRDAGIPDAVIDRVARGKAEFSLTEVVQGEFQAKRADKNYARVMKEWQGLKKLKLIQVYVDAKDDKDIKISDAVKAGVPEDVALKLATAETIAGSRLVAEVKKNPKWAKPLLVNAALGKPIALGEVEGLGVPEAAADKLFAGAPVLKSADLAKAYGKALKDASKSRAKSGKLQRDLRKLFPVIVMANAGRGWNIRQTDAALAGVPKSLATKLARGETFKGSALVEVLKEKPTWVKKPIYSAAALDLDIFLGDASEAGVPDAIARLLAGEGKSFKGSALNEAIAVNHPKWMKIWGGRVKKFAIFKDVPKTAVNKLDRKYAVSLKDVFAEARTPTVSKTLRDAQGKTIDADLSNVMVVNANGRKESFNFLDSSSNAGQAKMSENDYIFVPDRNSKFRMIWLVAMSLLVCTVGVSNSMLMAVTERFKEIGTMKCLGATDSFVRTLFILESSMLGIVASILGWAVGFVLMVLLAGMSKGWDVVGTLSFVDVARVFVQSVLFGLLVTIAATIAPAHRASRMPAAMALRTEI